MALSQIHHTRLQNPTLHITTNHVIQISQYQQYQINQQMQIVILTNKTITLMVMNVIYQIQILKIKWIH